MKTIFTICLGACLGLGITSEAKAQDTLASGLGLYVFPSNDQSKEQQDTDELACYKWAKEQSGVDPMNPPEVQAVQVDKNPQMGLPLWEPLEEPQQALPSGPSPGMPARAPPSGPW